MTLEPGCIHTLVILPTYNEISNVRILIPQLLTQERLDILFVDDSSPDGTAEYLQAISSQEPRIHVIRRPSKAGLGTAYRDALRYMLAGTYDAAVFMDADMSHAPACIGSLVELTGTADYVIGSRYVAGAEIANWSVARRLLSLLANQAARLATGLPIRDITSGFKCIKRNCAASLLGAGLKTRGFAFQIETAYHASREGFRLLETPVSFFGRTRGSSKLSPGIVIEAAWTLLRLRFNRPARRP